MTAATMSAFEARAGAAIVRKLANASGDFGSGLIVEGVFDDPSAEALAGGLPMIMRDPAFDVLEADLAGRELVRGDPVTITVNGAVTGYLLRSPPVRNTLHATLSMALEKDPDS